MVNALGEAGLGIVPVYVQSLKNEESVKFLRDLIDASSPDVVINLTGFAVSRPGEVRTPSILEAAGVPVLQAVAASDPKAAWSESARGLSARDTAMNVALPEVDGRVLTRAFAFRQPGDTNALTQHAPVQHVPDVGRCAFIAQQAMSWARLRKSAPAERRVALILANYPNRDGRLANGVGLDTPASVVTVMEALGKAGYKAERIPKSSEELMGMLTDGPTNDRSQSRSGGVWLPKKVYDRFFSKLPDQVQVAVLERLGPAADGPFL